jgi:hypothetical protein
MVIAGLSTVIAGTLVLEVEGVDGSVGAHAATIADMKDRRRRLDLVLVTFDRR